VVVTPLVAFSLEMMLSLSITNHAAFRIWQ